MGHTALGPLAFWEGYETLLASLVLYAIGIGVYSILVGTFYITLSQRDLRTRGDARMGLAGLLVMLPLVSFGLFLVLTISLFFLAKPIEGLAEAERVVQLLLISMAVVMGVRVTSYVSEHAAVDLAKMVPLGLLGVFLVDPGLLSLDASLNRLSILAATLDVVARFFVMIILLEVVLRGLWIATGGARRARTKSAPLPPMQHR